MKFLEKNLEQIIYETPNSLLRERGLEIYGTKLRQPVLGNYGKPDIITVVGNYDLDSSSKYYSLTIYELKRELIDVNALLQVSRYRAGLRNYYKTFSRSTGATVSISIVLVGESIQTSGDFVYLADSIPELNLYTYSYEFAGIQFENHGGWFLSTPAFPRINEKVICEVPGIVDLPF